MSNKAVIGFNFGFVCVKKWHEFRANKIQEQEQIKIHDCFWNRGSPGHTFHVLDFSKVFSLAPCR